MGAAKSGIRNYRQNIKELESLRGKSELVIKRTLSDVRERVPGWIASEVVKVYNIEKTDIKPSKKEKGKKLAGQIKAQGETIDTAQILYSGRLLTPVHFGMEPAEAEKPKKVSKKDRLKVPGAAINFKNAAGPVATVSRVQQPYSITWEILKGKRKTVKGKYDTPWFLAPAGKKSETQIPFQRSPGHPKGFKTVAAHTVSLPQMVSSERTREQINAVIRKKLNKRIENHMKQLQK